MFAVDIILSVTRDGEQFFAQATGQGQAEIFASSDSTFFLTVVDAQLTFHSEDDGTVRSLTLHQGGDTHARRVEPWTPSPEEVGALAGRYYSPELETTYWLRAEDTTLVAEHQRHDPITLSPVAGDQGGSFRGDTWFFANVVFGRDDSGNVAEMLVSNGRVRSLRFVKQD